MGLFDFFKKKDKKAAAPAAAPAPQAVPEEKDIVVLQPVKGEVITLEAIDDGVFSSGALGKGVGIKPTGETVVAPVSGTVSTVAETKHAVGITGDDGEEVLVHVGLDTVMMKGEGFDVLVKEGEHVKAGQPILKFSEQAIKDAGYPTTTVLVVVNTDKFKDVKTLKTGAGEAGDEVLELVE